MTATRHAHEPPGGTLSAAILAVVTFSLFVALAVIVTSHRRPFRIDRSAAHHLGSAKGSSAFRFGEVVSLFGKGPVVALVALAIGAVILYRVRRLFIAGAIPAAAAASGILELGTKYVVRRPRPPTASLTGQSGYGFPSGHTTGFTAMVVALVGVLASLGYRHRVVILTAVVAALATVAIGLSRVVVGAHWATDVIGGGLLGAATASVVMLCAWVGPTILPGLDQLLAPKQGRPGQRQPSR